MALLDIRRRSGYLFLAVMLFHVILISAQVNSRSGVPVLESVTFGVFAEVQRGLGEGHRPWDARPNSTMTNGAVEQTVAGVDGQVLRVTYKGGEQKIVVPPDAAILAYAVGDKGELKPGAHVAIIRALKKPDGSLEANRVNVGRGEVVPQ